MGASYTVSITERLINCDPLSGSVWADGWDWAESGVYEGDEGRDDPGQSGWEVWPDPHGLHTDGDHHLPVIYL